MLIYKLTAGLPVDKDVVNRILYVVVNGEARNELVYPSNTSDFGEFSFRHNDIVRVALVDQDDAGNRSQPATFEFVALDTIPPSKPGTLGAVLLREDYNS